MTKAFKKRYVFWPRRDKDGWFLDRGWYLRSTWRLSGGYKMQLDFSIHHYAFHSEVEPHLVVFRGLFPDRAWLKEGNPTGPGGVEVWSLLREVWPIAEAELPGLKSRRNNPRYLTITGATDRLFRIYWRLLRDRPGYRLVDYVVIEREI